MITKTKGYLDSNGVIHATVEEAQGAEMVALLGPMLERAKEGSNGTLRVELLTGELLAQSEALLAILTIGPTSRPKARKAKGTTNPKRAARKAAVDASLEAGTDVPAAA